MARKTFEDFVPDPTEQLTCDGFSLSISWDPRVSAAAFRLTVRHQNDTYQIVTGLSGSASTHALIRQYFALMGAKWPNLGWHFKGSDNKITGF